MAFMGPFVPPPLTLSRSDSRMVKRLLPQRRSLQLWAFLGPMGLSSFQRTPLQAVSTVRSDLSRLAHYAPAIHHHCIGTTSHLFVLLLILIYLVSFFPALAALPTLSSSSPSSCLHDDSQRCR
ncbi:hypothetical protein MRB53_002397 [Persea americana]|uniref:Uncharacterized protein n=1 Tax=Persea americana TaxID=3435 RepID=A0ACC2MUH4_PERAE|nr:hypothetical protein MRB53_002397 [Persea americana]